MFRTLTLALTVAAAPLAAEVAITALPPVPTNETPDRERALAELGYLLFFDTRLSGDSSTSCADCHNPDFGFGDGSDLGRGYPGTQHWRNSQTLVNAAFLTNGLHWDGTVPSMLHQVPGAMSTSFAANIDETLAEERMKQIPAYVEQFGRLWDEEITLDQMAQAIAAFERTLISADSPYDRYLAGDTQAMSDTAKRGMELFNGKANCSTCHNGPLGTDEAFHNISVPRNPELQEDPLRQVTFRAAMRGFGLDAETYTSFDRDPGRYAATQIESELGAFRTAPLRYLTYTAPYMHNGIFYTLEEVVAFYNEGGTEDVFGTKSAEIKPLGLSSVEQAELVAFLESMSGTEILFDYPDLPNYESGVPETAFVGSAIAAEPNSVASLSLGNPETSEIAAASAGLVINGLGGSSTNTAVSETEGRYVTVQPGETLGHIAKREYGDILRYIDIYNANKDLIADPNNLIAGTRLVMPEVN